MNASRPPIRPEVLAPAGDWDCLRAAVAHGADAVYFGLQRFNARHRANNFTADDLPMVAEYLHDRAAKGFVTLNTLIFSDELDEFAETVRLIAAAGMDAVIVQDLGAAKLVKAIAPTLAVHASTQMTLSEPRGVRWAVEKLGVSRVVLPRELSIAEIREVGEGSPVPLEVFVHGAICVAYSGQCLTSEAIGGRSANRGQCAQACRLPYTLFVDGEERDLGDKAYLLSPRDLAAHDLIGELAAAGVGSLKIEGRLKGPEYVAAASKTYREAAEAVTRGESYAAPADRVLDLTLAYSRGFSPGFLAGVDHQSLVRGRVPKARGILLGRVRSLTRSGVVVERDANYPGTGADWLRAGDGLLFDAGTPDRREPGGRVWSVAFDQYHDGRAEVRFEPGFDLTEITPDMPVWKTSDPTLAKRYAARDGGGKLAIDAKLAGEIGGPLTLTYSGDGNEASASWAGPVVLGEKRATTAEEIRACLGRLGGTAFSLGNVELRTPPGAMLPKGVLNDLRRRAAQEFAASPGRSRAHRVVEGDVLGRLRAELLPPESLPHRPRLTVLARTLEQVEAVATWVPPDGLDRPAMVYADFEDVRRSRDAVAAARRHYMPVGVATLRILKPGEEGFLKPLIAAAPDAVLVRNLGALGVVREALPSAELVGDFSLNVANELTAGLLFGEGFSRLVPSFDLNWQQFAGMVRRSRAGRFEAVVHQHMPMFHMEHCVFAALLSEGKDFRDCGRPCDRHQLHLRDRAGPEHPVVPDAGCRNTVYQAGAQSAALYLEQMIGLGVGQFRVDLLRQTAAETVALIESYARAVAGRAGGADTLKRLKVEGRLGVAKTTLELV